MHYVLNIIYYIIYMSCYENTLLNSLGKLLLICSGHLTNHHNPVTAVQTRIAFSVYYNLAQQSRAFSGLVQLINKQNLMI